MEKALASRCRPSYDSQGEVSNRKHVRVSRRTCRSPTRVRGASTASISCSLRLGATSRVRVGWGRRRPRSNRPPSCRARQTSCKSASGAGQWWCALASRRWTCQRVSRIPWRWSMQMNARRRRRAGEHPGAVSERRFAWRVSDEPAVRARRRPEGGVRCPSLPQLPQPETP